MGSEMCIRDRIYALMNAVHNQTQIAKLLDRHKSTIGRELFLNRGLKRYRPKQACDLTSQRFEQNRNAAIRLNWVIEEAEYLVSVQLNTEYVDGKLNLSHETLYQRVYAHKARGDKLWQNLRCQKQKRKRYASGIDRWLQIPHWRP